MSDIQEQIKLAHKRAEENDIKLLKEEIKEIFNYFIKYANIEDSIKVGKLEDYITNLQTIEREYSALLSENAELRIQISAREEEYIKLQEENERLIAKNLELETLCDKYEEEHKTTFEEWKKDIQANKKAIEYINTHYLNANEPELLNILQGEQNE